MPSNIILQPKVARETRGRPRSYHADRAATSAETMRHFRSGKLEERKAHISVLDFETDPFDPNTQAPVYPFTACWYSEQFCHVIWSDNLADFIAQLVQLFDDELEPYTIYAHNGGKFDFMFLIHKLRGRVSFKGRALMAAKIGIHDLRDSTHILPMKLKEWKKDDFDYQKMQRDVRGKYREEIIGYMVNDCKALFQIVKDFVEEFGFKLTIGQAAMTELKKFYVVKKIGENMDETLRPWFFGGRVECLAGAGHFGSPGAAERGAGYQLYDVNAMYPDAMANYRHPVGKNFTFRRHGGIKAKTAFLELHATNFIPGGIGALITRRQNASGQWETTAQQEAGIFKTTIHEFNAALELGLLQNVDILRYIDCDEWSDFSQFIVPMYERRALLKAEMKAIAKATPGFDPEDYDTWPPEYLVRKKEDIFTKFLLNNSYGKFAMNPRKFKDHYFTDHNGTRPEGFEGTPVYRCPDYDVWERPAPRRSYNNVATAASITGVARAKLLRAIVNAVDPIYCDTDSLICRSISGVEISDTKLGAWKLEDTFDEVAIAGKKLYACRTRSEKAGGADHVKVRSKGVREGALGWNDILHLLEDESVNGTFQPVSIDVVASFAPAFRKDQSQHYIPRRVTRTAPLGDRKVA